MKMLRKIWYFFFGEPSASKAVKNMEKAVAKLSNAVNYQEEKAAAMADAAKLATAAATFAKEEAARAGRIGKKLADLFEI